MFLPGFDSKIHPLWGSSNTVYHWTPQVYLANVI